MSCKNCTLKFPLIKTFFLTVLLAFSFLANGQVSVTGADATTNAGSPYATLSAAFTNINASSQAGNNIAITITADFTETDSVSIRAVLGMWNSLSIQPSGARTISGTVVGRALLSFMGADNVTVNGLNTSGNSLNIQNLSTSSSSGTSTIRLYNGATNNLFTNLTLQGSATMSTTTNGGIVFISTDGLTANGNDNNSFTFCNFTGIGSNLPSKGINGNGSTTTTAIGNSNITIDNCKFYDIFNGGVASAAIYTNGGCNTWNITNNKFYQTGTRTFTGTFAHRSIWLTGSSSTSGMQNATITGNTIGYASDAASGVATYTGSTGKVGGIFITAIAGSTNAVNNNTIASISLTGVTSNGTLSTGAPLTGIVTTSGNITFNNNTIGSQSATGSLEFSTNTTTSTDVIGAYFFGSGTETVNASNNHIGGITFTNAGASGTHLLRAVYINAIVGNISTNNIGGTIANSIQVNAPTTGASVQGINTNSASTLTSNTIRNLTTNSTNTGTGSSASTIGIVATGSGIATISTNTISALSNTTSTAAIVVHGIAITAGSANIVERNFIHNLNASTTSATGEISGIRISGGTSTYRNNMIALGANITNAIGAVASNSAVTGLIGINEFLGTNNIWNNTVYIGGSPTAGSGASYAFNGVQTVNSRSFRNNIFVNARSNAGATGSNYIIKINGTAPNPSGLTINNNIYFGTGTGNVFGFFNSSDVLNLGAWKTAVGQDNGSINANPELNNPTAITPDLHIHPTNPSVAEGNGTDLGVINDFDGETRSGLTPVDIGADAGNYVASDVVGPSISYSNFSNTLCTLDRTISATITDASGINTTSGTKPRLYFKKSTDANTYVGNTNADNGWKYVEATNSSSPFSFTTDYTLLQSAVVGGDVIEYFVSAEDLAGVVNVSMQAGTFNAAPTTVALSAAAFPVAGVGSYTILSGGLSSNVTIGAAGTYPTLTGVGGLFEALNAGGLTGNITASIIDASVTETGAIALNQINYGCAGTYTLTIKPDAGVTATLTGSASGIALIKLNGADNVVIDGSNNGSSSRDLTITNTATTASTTGVWITSLGTGLGATNNTIKNCNISTGSTSVTTYGISVSGTSIGASGADNDNVTIQNNSITSSATAIYANGTAALSAGGNDNLLITQNTIVFNGTNAAYGIRVGNSITSEVSQNNIDLQSSSSSFAVGISAETGYVNSTILRNLLTRIFYTGTSGYGGRGITVGGQTASNLTIANNVIYGVGGDNYTSFGSSSSAGIMLGTIGNSSTISTTIGGVNLYYNSINMYGDFSRAANTITTALYIGSGASTLDIRNNVFRNSLNNTNVSGTGSKAYAIYSAVANTAFTNINYNSYFVSGTQGVLGFLTSDRVSLVDIQTGFGQNTNSISSDPQFNSNTNLIPDLSSTLLNAAITGTGITNDYINATRSVTTPSIGAYEAGGDFFGPIITYTNFTNGACTDNRTLSATITDGSGVNTTAGTKPRLYFKKSTDANTYVGNTNADNGWKYVEATNSSSPFSFTTDFTLLQAAVVGGDVIQYFVVAQDNQMTPLVSINSGVFNATPTSVALTAGAFPITGTINSYTVIAAVLTDITIGATGTYTTLTGASGLFADLNTKALSANTTVRIIDATIAETGANSLNQINYGCATYTLTIKPDVGVTTTLSGSATALINLNGADNVIIDGSNNGTSSKDMTITNTNTTGSTIRFINDATSNTVKNCILTAANTSTSHGIINISTGTTTGNDNNIIESNNLGSATNTVYCFRNSGSTSNTTIKNSGNQILSNNIFNFTNTGIRDEAGSVGALYSANNIYQTNTQTSGLIGFTPRSTSIEGFTFTRNRIYDMLTTSTSAIYGVQLWDIVGNSSIIGEVSNNMISIDNTTSLDVRGIHDNSAVGEYFNIYNNTVYLAGATSGVANSEAYYWGIASTSNVKNNIFINLKEGGTGKHYGIRFNATLANITSDNNNIYNGGGTASVFGNDGTADRTSLTAWQTATSKDANSINYNNSFTSVADLHLTNTNFNNYFTKAGGTPIAGITTDIDGGVRNATMPTIGADEVSLPGFWTGGTSTVWDGAVTGNWDDNTLPIGGSNIFIPNNVTNKPVITGINPMISNLYIGTANTLSLNGQILTITGAISGSGSFIGSSASNLSIGGSGAFGTINLDQTTDGTTNLLNNFTLNRSTSGTASFGNKTVIAGVLTLTDGALTTGGLLTLKSTSTTTARVDPVLGSITGNVTVERYLPSRRAWRLLTAPVTQTTPSSLNTTWKTLVDIVGPSGSNLTQTRPAYNFLTFDASTNAWVNVSDPTTVNLTGSSLNNAFCAFIPGPLGTAITDSANVTLTSTGALLTGTKTFNITAPTDNYALIPNPYASPVDLNAVYGASTGIYRTFYTWDPRQGGSIGTGGYITMSWNGASYDILGNGNATAQDLNVQSGQAFFVQASAPNPSIVFDEAHKSTTNINTVFGVGTGNVDNLRIGVQRIESGSPVLVGEVLTSYHNNYSKAVNFNDDAEKMWNNEENIAIRREGYNLSIERRPFIGGSNDSIFLGLSSLRANTNYSLSFSPSNWDAGSKAYLIDKLLSTETLIDLNSTNFVHQFTSTVATANDRFVVVFRGATLPNRGFTLGAEKLGTNKVKVNWEAQGEVGVREYALERSVDGVSYQVINTQQAKNNNTVSNYTYTDNSPMNGVNYYRVKTTQQNDVERYSSIVTINFKQQSSNPVTVYPNPVKGNQIGLQLQEIDKGLYSVRILSIEGKEVYKQQLQVSGTSLNTTISPTSKLASGTYTLQVVGKNNSYTQKIVVE